MRSRSRSSCFWWCRPCTRWSVLHSCRSQRTQNRMVEQLDVAPEAGFTLRDDRIHRRELCPNLVSHLLHRQPPRLHDCGGLSSGRYVAQSHDHERQHALRHGWPRGERCAAGDHFLQSSGRSDIGQVQMFQHLRRTPLPWEMPAQLVAGHAFHGRLQRFFQRVQAGIHGTTGQRHCAATLRPWRTTRDTSDGRDSIRALHPV